MQALLATPTRASVGRPVLVYDGRCAFCRRWVRRWKARTRRRVLYVPLQVPLIPALLGVSRARARRAVQLVEPDGKRYEGAEAVFRALARAPELRTLVRVVRLPPLRWAAAWTYRRIAHHRTLAAPIDRWFFGGETSPLHASRVRALFLRGLGFVYLIAFTSLRAQVLGLYGRRGILPAQELLSATREDLGRRRSLHALPSVFWFGASDQALVRACRAGQALSLVLVCGRAPRTTLLGLWLLYLSFVTIGDEFLSYQWDTLLLETSVHALVVASPRSARLFGPRREDPSWQAVILMRALVFRFFYEAGIAKLRSGDSAWRTLTACSHHYETQPLPTPLSWNAHRLPRPVQRLSTLAALGIECVAPFAAFAPRRVRRAGFGALTLLQAAIALTGNYGFFNVLSIVLALWLLDDAALPRLQRLLPADRPPQRTRGLERVVSTAGLAVLLPLAVGIHLLRYGSRRPPRPLARLAAWCASFRSTGAYGLFSVMTRRRPEIVLEGSDDGVHWLPYELRYKPGDPARRSRWVAPHQPRLDWQMWFAAFELPPAWFVRLVVRLLEGAPEVEALFEERPFSDHPPHYIRAELYEYRMADRETVRRTGARWTRRSLGPYLPPVRLGAEPS